MPFRIRDDAEAAALGIILILIGLQIAVVDPVRFDIFFMNPRKTSVNDQAEGLPFVCK
jgi:hypothetical protein